MTMERYVRYSEYIIYVEMRIPLQTLVNSIITLDICNATGIGIRSETVRCGPSHEVLTAADIPMLISAHDKCIK